MNVIAFLVELHSQIRYTYRFRMTPAIAILLEVHRLSAYPPGHSKTGTNSFAVCLRARTLELSPDEKHAT